MPWYKIFACFDLYYGVAVVYTHNKCNCCEKNQERKEEYTIELVGKLAAGRTKRFDLFAAAYTCIASVRVHLKHDAFIINSIAEIY